MRTRFAALNDDYVKPIMATDLLSMFRAEPEDQRTDSGKLHELYWNRAELKKEFAALRNEKYELQERIKQEQGATARVQQQLEHLENLLLDREWVFNVVVFYQLRRLHAHCHNKLARFAEQLKQQHEERMQSEALARWNQRRNAEASRMEVKVGELRLQTQLLEDQLQSQRHKLLTMNSLLKLIRGRALTAEIDELVERIDAGHAEEREVLAALDANQNQSPPSQQGLSVKAKRSINFMILSYLQQLYLNFAEDRLAQLAKESSEKSVGAINYGDKKDCDAIVKNLQARWKFVEQLADSPEILQHRAGLITDIAVFRHDDDAVPVPASVATLFDIDDGGAVRRQDANLFGENYFGVTQVVSR